jgi:hypothetical protein
MRKSTLGILAYVIVFPFVYLLPALAEWSGLIHLPRWSFVTSGVATFLIAGLLTTVLTPLNRQLLTWRKARGRNIEEEERYESDHGMISLKPKE